MHQGRDGGLRVCIIPSCPHPDPVRRQALERSEAPCLSVCSYANICVYVDLHVLCQSIVLNT